MSYITMKQLLEAVFSSDTRQEDGIQNEAVYLYRTKWDLHH
jgi:hypothetical protein